MTQPAFTDGRLVSLRRAERRPWLLLLVIQKKNGNDESKLVQLQASAAESDAYAYVDSFAAEDVAYLRRLPYTLVLAACLVLPPSDEVRAAPRKH